MGGERERRGASWRMARPGHSGHVCWIVAAFGNCVVTSAQRRSPRRSGLGREARTPAQDRDPPTVQAFPAADPRAIGPSRQERILLNALSGVVRTTAPTRSAAPDRSIAATPATKRRLHRRVIGFARFLADSLTATPRARERAVAAIRGRRRAMELPTRSITRRRLHRRHLLLRLTTERAVPMMVAVVVLVAAGVSLAPAAAP